MKVKKLIARVSTLTLVVVVGLSVWGSAMAADSYKGVTLNLVVYGPYMLPPTQKWAKVFEEQTGAKINVHGVPYLEIYDRVMVELVAETGGYDIVAWNVFNISDAVEGGFAVALDPYIDKEKWAWEDIASSFRERYMVWGDKVYAMIVDGDCHALYYRKDYMDDPIERARFEQKYGYAYDMQNLTWDEYIDLAEFFSRDTNGDGKIDFWGVSISPVRGLCHMWWFNLFFSYGGRFLDPETMEPGINNPAGVKALENMMELMKHCPPGVLSWMHSDDWEQFAAGKIAMVTNWADTGKWAADPEKSQVMGKWSTAMMPGSKQIWDYKNKKWRELQGVNHRPYLGDGWAWFIVNTSKNKEAAADFIRFFTSPDVSLDVVMSPYGYDPYRYSHFASPKFRAAFEGAEEYLDGYMRNIESGVPDLKIPGATEYYDRLSVYMSKALAGEISPEEALNEAAKEWKQITARRGFEAQKRMYRLSIGLPE